jgi:hypothetical protein
MNEQLKRIKKNYSDAELREIFTKRLDDDLFIEAAQSQYGKLSDNYSDSVLVWHGAELLGVIRPPDKEVK